MKKLIYISILIAASVGVLLFTQPGNQVIGKVMTLFVDIEEQIRAEEKRHIGEYVNVHSRIHVQGLELEVKDFVNKNMVIMPVIQECKYCTETLNLLASEPGLDVLVIGMNGREPNVVLLQNSNMVLATSEDDTNTFNLPVKFSPTLFFVDPSGKIKKKIIGFRPNIADIIRNG